MDAPELPILIVGAGPTGLALATQLQLFGTPFRIIDRSIDRAQESRALAVQARTLELLDIAGLGEELVARGRTSTRLVLHLGARAVADVRLGEIGATDTRFPFILFVSQADTEALIGDHLTRRGSVIERGVELASFTAEERCVDCALRHEDGREESVRASYLVGCDGAHSAVRKGAGFAFEGGSYPQHFVLGDIEADGPLERGAINSFVGGGGVAMFFPLDGPTTWRVIAMRTATRRRDDDARDVGIQRDDSIAGPLTLDELQSIVTPPTDGTVIVRDAAWLTHFRLHHRQIEHYRNGRVFLAGDAAHIHSPVGGQGMNTGIQDAWNLGWKLALVTRGAASVRLLDSYEAERWPVGRFLLRYTDRLFGTFTRAMSAGVFATWAREVVAPHLLPAFLGSARLRTAAFRFMSELGIHYRKSPAVHEGEPRLHVGPRAGERLPDVRLTSDGDGHALQRAVLGPHLTLVLCGEVSAWDVAGLDAARRGREDLLVVRHLAQIAAQRHLRDPRPDLLTSLGARDGAQYLVRPDGYIAFRCAGYALDALQRYLAEWYPAESTKTV